MASQFRKLPLTGGGGGGGAVDSFNGRTGTVVSQSGDYSAALVVNTPAGNISATTVQAAINELDSEKQAVITGAATTITSSNLTASRAVVSDGSGKVAVSPVTSTELAQLSGVTSNVQTQLNAKEPTITVLPVAKGGTGASTAAQALLNLGVAASYTFSNTNYIVPGSGSYLVNVVQSGVMSASRTVTLPPANTLPQGAQVLVVDDSGTVSNTNKILIVPSAGDTIKGGTTPAELTIPYNSQVFICDGVSNYSHAVIEVEDGGTGISTATTNGQLLIGNSTTGKYNLSTLTAGPGISIANSPGGITITNSDSASFVNIDGGSASTIYTTDQFIDGGSSS